MIQYFCLRENWVNCTPAVSYTHLDVYKRQVLQFVLVLVPEVHAHLPTFLIILKVKPLFNKLKVHILQFHKVVITFISARPSGFFCDSQSQHLCCRRAIESR